MLGVFYNKKNFLLPPKKRKQKIPRHSSMAFFYLLSPCVFSPSHVQWCKCEPHPSNLFPRKSGTEKVLWNLPFVWGWHWNWESDLCQTFCAEMIGFFHLSHGPENDISCLLMFHQILFVYFLLLFSP